MLYNIYNIKLVKVKMQKQPNQTKLEHTRKTVRDLESKTSLTRGEILIKLIFLEMTPTEIIEEHRMMEEANWYDCTDYLNTGALI